MAWDFQVTGWMDWQGNQYDDPPDGDASEVFGMWAHWWNEDTGEEDWHWTYIDEPWDTWTQWLDYMTDMAESEYGMSMA